jgi:hypothetical protein
MGFVLFFVLMGLGKERKGKKRKEKNEERRRGKHTWTNIPGPL